MPPGNLTLDELVEWGELAPLAFKAGTLSFATRQSLRDLCELIVLKRKLVRALDETGVLITSESGIAANPLLVQIKGYAQRIEAGRARFQLAPMGKELPRGEAEKPVDPFSEFDDAPAGAEARPH